MFKRGTGAVVFDSHEAWNGPVHHVENRIILKLIRRQMWPAAGELKKERCGPLIPFWHSCLADHHYHCQTSSDTFINAHKHSQHHSQVKHMEHMDPSLSKWHVTAAAAESKWLSLQKHLPLRKWKVIFSMKIYICQNTNRLTDLTKFHLSQPVFFYPDREVLFLSIKQPPFIMLYNWR